jgi:hypothetical protein
MRGRPAAYSKSFANSSICAGVSSCVAWQAGCSITIAFHLHPDVIFQAQQFVRADVPRGGVVEFDQQGGG